MQDPLQSRCNFLCGLYYDTLYVLYVLRNPSGVEPNSRYYIFPLKTLSLRLFFVGIQWWLSIAPLKGWMLTVPMLTCGTEMMSLDCLVEECH